MVEAGTIIIAAGGTIRSSIAGARIIAGAGGITVAATGTLTEAYISSIRSSGSVDLSAGTYTPSAAKWILTGAGKTLKLAAGHILYDLITAAPITLASNISVSNELVQAEPISAGAYAITHTGGGSKWYDRRRLHFNKNIGPRPFKKVGRILDYLSADEVGY